MKGDPFKSRVHHFFASLHTNITRESIELESCIDYLG